jgi:hypothetical protein
VGTVPELIKAWNIIVVHGPKYGLYINPKKSEWIPLSNNLECPFSDVPTHTNFVILGAPIGDPSYTDEAVDTIFCKYETILKALPDLNHSQSAIMLLRYCFSFCKAVYIMRTVPPPLYDKAAVGFDNRMKATPAVLAPHLLSSEDRIKSHYSYQTNYDRTQSDYSKLMDECNFQKLEKHSTPQDIKRMSSCKAPHAVAWLYAPPCRAQGLYFSDAQFRIKSLPVTLNV